MKFLRNLNPFYWRHKARCLQDQLDNVAEARLRQEQEILKYHKKWLAEESKVKELQDLVPDYSLPENAELANYLFGPNAEKRTAREAKMLLDLDQLRSQLEVANEELEHVNKVLAKERYKNQRWFQVVMGFGVNDGILMNAALRGRDLTYIDVEKDLGSSDE